MKKALCIILPLFLASLCVFSNENISYQILPYDQKITLNGKADEKIWKQLDWSSDFFTPDGKGVVPSKFKAFADRDHLYLLLSLQGDFVSTNIENKEFDKNSVVDMGAKAFSTITASAEVKYSSEKETLVWEPSVTGGGLKVQVWAGEGENKEWSNTWTIVEDSDIYKPGEIDLLK